MLLLLLLLLRTRGGRQPPLGIALLGEHRESWGCPALDDRLVGDVVEYLSDGSMLFFWYPDGDWSSASAYLD